MFFIQHCIKTMSRFVFEIFSEEIPATLQKKISIDYKQFIEKEFKTLNIQCKNEEIFIGITLNRLVLKCNNCDITKEQANELVKNTLKDFSKTFPRTMCYPQLEVRWLRPIRSLFVCIDDSVLQGSIFGVEFQNGTYTQKFDFHKCNSCEEYEQVLKNEEIEIDYNYRFNFVKDNIFQENQEYKNIKLIEEIAGMSEYCIKPMKSLLDSKFYILPFELIELVLRENQRYVVFHPDEQGNIYFLIFGDKITKDENKRKQIIEGHKKVVNARLDDALYYWNLDKDKIDDTEKLKDILDERIFIDDIKWKDYLVNQQELLNNFDIEDKKIKQEVVDLIYKTKIDLATGVVAEFPELQGIIGGYYFNYKFNPYVVNYEKMLSIYDNNIPVSVLYYYIIDRFVYVKTMYKQGKQPTSSGDKYKVKARIDDILTILKIVEENDYKDIHISKILSIIKQNDEIYKLFGKRYQKYIEDEFKDNKNIKKFADVCVKLLDNKNFKMFLNLEEKVNLIDDAEFIKTYKRIIGYTNGINIEKNENILNKVKEIFSNEDILKSINMYLDNNKIADSLIIKQALKYIEDKYFSSKLEVEFLSIV